LETAARGEEVDNNGISTRRCRHYGASACAFHQELRPLDSGASAPIFLRDGHL
jgi:hypothetical protein